LEKTLLRHSSQEYAAGAAIARGAAPAGYSPSE